MAGGDSTAGYTILALYIADLGLILAFQIVPSSWGVTPECSSRSEPWEFPYEAPQNKDIILNILNRWTYCLSNLSFGISESSTVRRTLALHIRLLGFHHQLHIWSPNNISTDLRAEPGVDSEHSHMWPQNQT